MLSPNGMVLDVDQLLAPFDTATLRRGLQYVKQGRVRQIAWSDNGLALTCRCAGSGNNLYTVTVGFQKAGGGVRLAGADCSCPVGFYCKHVVALLIAADSNEAQPPSPDRWRTVLTEVLDEVVPRPEEHSAPIGLEFSASRSTRYHPSYEISVRPLTIGKRGTWIKTGLTWQRLTRGTDPGQFEPRQYEAIRLLATDVHRSGMIHPGEWMPITYVPQSFWSQLDDALEAGVTVVPGTGIRAIEFIKSAQFRLDFASGDAGSATMSAVLIVDGEPRDANDVGLIGLPSPHGMYSVVDGVVRLGRLDPPPGRTIADLVARGERLHIPPDAFADLSLEILPLLEGAAPLDVEEGLFTPPTIIGPMPVLTVKVNRDDARAYWSTRYEVNGQRHDFDPGAKAQRSGYRDAAAEDSAWARIQPALREVAAASITWRRQALQHIMGRSRGTGYPTGIDGVSAIESAKDAAIAAIVASMADRRCAVNLTVVGAAVLCAETLPQLECRDAFTVVMDEGAPAFRAADAAPLLEFSSDDGEPVGNDWFDLSITVRVDDRQVPLPAIIAELTRGATHMMLPDGVYFKLDTPELLRLRELLDEARALGEIEGDRVNAGSHNVTLWEELLTLGVVDKQMASWQEGLTRLAAARPPAPVEPPEGLDATLRDYQRDGLNWLSFLWDNELGGVLADDMGLGKTVQTLALIARARQQGSGRFLVVAPTSVVTNWAAECRKFTPGLTAVTVTSTQARSGTSLAEQAAAADIVVTSYALLRIDFEAYAGIDWAGVIFDEAQFVKNHASKTHQCARRLDARFKLAITGTPMENNLMELWALLSITAPGLFPSPRAFTEYFRKPIESGKSSERLSVLRRRVKPMMLRRTKSQVAKELPPKQEQVLTLDLSAKHRKVYDTRMARERQKVLGLLGDWEKNRFQVFRSLTLLRQLSLHAGLVDESKLDVNAAKVDYLVEQLPELVAEGHSALVFSQFTGFLDILRAQLDAVGVAYSYLDGSSSSRQRDDAIRSFKAGDNKVFLISLKAGGFGLNLTEADYCFVCDPWWNPAAEAQAIDRTHRIGQTRPVTVYRLVSQGTIEEKVVALQERKRELFTAVVDEGDVFGTAITASDVRELFG